MFIKEKIFCLKWEGKMQLVSTVSVRSKLVWVRCNDVNLRWKWCPDLITTWSFFIFHSEVISDKTDLMADYVFYVIVVNLSKLLKNYPQWSIFSTINLLIYGHRSKPTIKTLFITIKCTGLKLQCGSPIIIIGRRRNESDCIGFAVCKTKACCLTIAENTKLNLIFKTPV